MCNICHKARKLSTKQALTYIAQAMEMNRGSDCLDKLIGEMIGVDIDTVDTLDQDTVSLTEARNESTDE